MSLYCDTICSRMKRIVGVSATIKYVIDKRQKKIAFLLYVNDVEELNINFAISSENECNINWMGTNNYKGHKLGYMLLRFLCEYLLFDRMSDLNMVVSLDDMSDHFRMKTKNIYYNAGFRYVDDDFGPEMTGILSNIYTNCLMKTEELILYRNRCCGAENLIDD
jgi:hypothetical protein